MVTIGIFIAVALIAVIGIKILSRFIQTPVKTSGSHVAAAQPVPLLSRGISFAAVALIFLLLETGLLVFIVAAPYIRAHDTAGIAVYLFFIVILLLSLLLCLKERVLYDH
jgi:hypothetical protein